jgi:hypothetical protein
LKFAILNHLALANFQQTDKEQCIVRLIFKTTLENLELKCVKIASLFQLSSA